MCSVVADHCAHLVVLEHELGHVKPVRCRPTRPPQLSDRTVVCAGLLLTAGCLLQGESTCCAWLQTNSQPHTSPDVVATHWQHEAGVCYSKPQMSEARSSPCLCQACTWQRHGYRGQCGSVDPAKALRHNLLLPPVDSGRCHATMGWSEVEDASSEQQMSRHPALISCVTGGVTQRRILP